MSFAPGQETQFLVRGQHSSIGRCYSWLRDTIPSGLLSFQSIPEGQSLMARASGAPQSWRRQRRAKGDLRLTKAPKRSRWDGDRPGSRDLSVGSWRCLDFFGCPRACVAGASLPSAGCRGRGSAPGHGVRAGRGLAGELWGGAGALTPLSPQGRARAAAGAAAGAARAGAGGEGGGAGQGGAGAAGAAGAAAGGAAPPGPEGAAEAEPGPAAPAPPRQAAPGGLRPPALPAPLQLLTSLGAPGSAAPADTGDTAAASLHTPRPHAWPLLLIFLLQPLTASRTLDAVCSTISGAAGMEGHGTRPRQPSRGKSVFPVKSPVPEIHLFPVKPVCPDKPVTSVPFLTP